MKVQYLGEVTLDEHEQDLYAILKDIRRLT